MRLWAGTGGFEHLWQLSSLRPARPIPHQRGEVVLVCLGQVGAPSISSLVQRHQVGTSLRKPAQIMLADARPEMKGDGRHRRRAGLQRRIHDRLDLVAPIREAGDDRPDQHPARHSGLVEPTYRLEPPSRVRRAGLGQPPHLLIEGPYGKAGVHRGASGGRRQQPEVAENEGGFGENGKRVGRVGQDPDDTLCQAVPALAALVRVRVGPHGDRITRPTACSELHAQALNRVDLDDDPPLEVLSSVQAEIGVGRPGEAVGARVAAASVHVDRVPKRHAGRRRHLVDDRAGVHMEELHAFEHARAPAAVEDRLSVEHRRLTGGVVVRQPPPQPSVLARHHAGSVTGSPTVVERMFGS